MARTASPAASALVAFLILTPFIKVAENGGITVMPVEWIGSKGLFVAMIGSLLWTELFCWLKRKSWSSKCRTAYHRRCRSRSRR